MKKKIDMDKVRLIADLLLEAAKNQLHPIKKGAKG